MLNNYLNRPRKKAWIGAAIGAGVGLLSSVFGASKQKRAQERQYALQRNMELRNAGLTSASNLTQAFSNIDELNEEFRNRFLRCGGRRKAAWGAEDTSALISGLGSAGQNFVTNLVGQAQQKANYINAINPLISKKDDEAVYDSAARSNFLNNYYRTTALRMGGRKQSRRC